MARLFKVFAYIYGNFIARSKLTHVGRREGGREGGGGVVEMLDFNNMQRLFFSLDCSFGQISSII